MRVPKAVLTDGREEKYSLKRQSILALDLPIINIFVLMLPLAAVLGDRTTSNLDIALATRSSSLRDPVVRLDFLPLR